MSRLVSHRLSKSDRRVVMLVNTLVKVSSCIADIIWRLDLGATSEYPATNLHILSTLQNEENRKKEEFSHVQISGGVFCSLALISLGLRCCPENLIVLSTRCFLSRSTILVSTRRLIPFTQNSLFKITFHHLLS